MSWLLPFLALPCSPFLISPTTWCQWWRWSISRVSVGRRGSSPSGTSHRGDGLSWVSGRAASLRESCSQARGAQGRGGPSDRRIEGETEAAEEGGPGPRQRSYGGECGAVPLPRAGLTGQVTGRPQPLLAVQLCPRSPWGGAVSRRCPLFLGKYFKRTWEPSFRRQRVWLRRLD